MRRARNNSNIQRRRGFTLAELVVAIGAALLLTLGVGQIFQSVGDIVSQGSAIAEVDQLARAIERQIRDDFNALNTMQADETFLAIRNRVVTDVYLSREDLEADMREGTAGTAFSRIIPETRLDEIMFLAQSTEDFFASYEQEPNTMTTVGGPGTNFVPGTVTSRYARIYYGHGLRPVPEPRNLAPNFPFVRVPDGDFGSPIDPSNLDNIYSVGTYMYETREDDGTTGTGSIDTADVSEEERNRFAGSWPLARQALLLHNQGGDIMGRGRAGGPGSTNSIIGGQREYAPFIRDLESEYRFEISDRAPDPGEGDTAFSSPNSIDTTAIPHPRLIRHGRTDICAQSLEEVRQWLEGRQRTLPLPVPFGSGVPTYNDATAWNGGEWDVFPINLLMLPGTNSSSPGSRDAPLWDRFLSPFANVQTSLEENFREIQSAIAGCFTRVLVETSPPDIDREVTIAGATTGSTAPEDALMDLHATLAPSCSRFEVAWTETSAVWNQATALSNATFPNNFFRPERENVSTGGQIWFDYNFTRRDLAEISLTTTTRRQDPEILPAIAPVSDAVNPPLFRTTWAGIPSVATEREDRLNLDANAFAGSINAYDPLRTGGDVGEDELADNDDREYLAIFPFRLLSEGSGDTGGYVFDRPFPKPTHIRIRMTLHDSQLVLREGKTFEFVLEVSPR